MLAEVGPFLPFAPSVSIASHRPQSGHSSSLEAQRQLDGRNTDKVAAHRIKSKVRFREPKTYGVHFSSFYTIYRQTTFLDNVRCATCRELEQNQLGLCGTRATNVLLAISLLDNSHGFPCQA